MNDLVPLLSALATWTLVLAALAALAVTNMRASRPDCPRVQAIG